MPSNDSVLGRSLSLGFSPCPNDTFMFDALVHGKIDPQGLEFKSVLDDVETLNRKALKGELDITKLSFAAFARVTDSYQLLNAGSALGNGIGPLVISKKNLPFSADMFRNKIVAIPGEYTTANFLFIMFFTDVKRKKEMIFSEVEEAVLTGQVDAGVIIHENRFTYAQKGLQKIADLGELWEKDTGQPIPLGGIAVKKELPLPVKLMVEKLVQESVQFAMQNPHSGDAYVKQHSQEMDPVVCRKHIDAYVNNYSISLGPEGRAAILAFFRKAQDRGIVHSLPAAIFATPEFNLNAPEMEF